MQRSSSSSNGGHHHGNRSRVNRPKRPPKAALQARRLVEAIKFLRTDKERLTIRIEEQEGVITKKDLEVESLKAQLAEMKSALGSTSVLFAEGFSSLQSAKARVDQLHQGIAIDTGNTRAAGASAGPSTRSPGLLVGNTASDNGNTRAARPAATSFSQLMGNTAVDNGNTRAARPAATSFSGLMGNTAVTHPAKLQARVKPMVQGMQVMFPSIMLQRLQPDELERQLNYTPRAVSATTPISQSVQEASLPVYEDGGNREREEDGAQGSSSGSRASTGPPRDVAHPLRRSSRVRRQ